MTDPVTLGWYGYLPLPLSLDQYLFRTEGRKLSEPSGWLHTEVVYR